VYVCMCVSMCVLFFALMTLEHVPCSCSARVRECDESRTACEHARLLRVEAYERTHTAQTSFTVGQAVVAEKAGALHESFDLLCRKHKQRGQDVP
jgi:hypothetical protein